MLQTQHHNQDKHNGTRQYWLLLICFVINFTLTQKPFAQEEKPIDETQLIATDLETSSTTEPSAEANASAKQAKPQNLPTLTRLAQQKQQELTNAMVGMETIQLTADKPIIAFWQEDLSGTPAGAVLLLHDSDHSPIWPETLLNLHEYLPRHGWATLSLELLSLPEPPKPARQKANTMANQKDSMMAPEEGEKVMKGSPDDEESAQENVDETNIVHTDEEAKALANTPQKNEGTPTNANQNKPSEPSISLEETLTANQLRIAQGLAYLQDQSQFNVAIVGVGFGAYQALQYLNEMNSGGGEVKTLQKSAGNSKKQAVIDGQVRALVTVDLNNQYPQMNIQSFDLLQTPSVMTMELITQVALPTRADMIKRKLWANKIGYKLYRQRFLSVPDGMLFTHKETELSKAIRGFLQRYAAGEAL